MDTCILLSYHLINQLSWVARTCLRGLHSLYLSVVDMKLHLSIYIHTSIKVNMKLLILISTIYVLWTRNCPLPLKPPPYFLKLMSKQNQWSESVQLKKPIKTIQYHDSLIFTTLIIVLQLCCLSLFIPINQLQVHSCIQYWFSYRWLPV